MWVLASGKLLQNDRFQQLTWIKYEVTPDKIIQIEPKVDLRKRTGKSPNLAEAFMLTFTQGPPEPRIR